MNHFLCVKFPVHISNLSARLENKCCHH